MSTNPQAQGHIGRAEAHSGPFEEPSGVTWSPWYLEPVLLGARAAWSRCYLEPVLLGAAEIADPPAHGREPVAELRPVPLARPDPLLKRAQLPDQPPGDEQDD